MIHTPLTSEDEQDEEHSSISSSLDNEYRNIDEDDEMMNHNNDEEDEDDHQRDDDEDEEGTHPSLNAPSRRDPRENIEDIFRCPICLGRVENAQLCPSCSKMCCDTCIKRWLTEQKAQCPHCRSPLYVHQLVPCRFVAEVSVELDKLKVKKNNKPSAKIQDEICEIHQAPLYYYCITDNTSICSDCAMFDKKHQGHEFQHLKTVYQKHVDSVQSEALAVRKKLRELTMFMQSVESNIQAISKAKDERATELNTALEQMQLRLDAQLKVKLLTLLAQKNNVMEEIESLDSMLHEVDQQLNSHLKSQFIGKTPELTQILKEAQLKPTAKFGNNTVSTDFESEIVPPYQSCTFHIKNYFTLVNQAGVIYSDPLYINGLTWRLKVYPNGNGVAKGLYISVFLELLKGPRESSKYEYKVEMINHLNPNTIVAREFASDFEEGECWGYNRFYQIDLLQREGFVSSEEESIMLKFYVRAPTYFQQSRDQQRYIAHLEAQRSESLTRENGLKEEVESLSKKLARAQNKPSRLFVSDSSLPPSLLLKNDENANIRGSASTNLFSFARSLEKSTAEALDLTGSPSISGKLVTSPNLPPSPSYYGNSPISSSMSNNGIIDDFDNSQNYEMNSSGNIPSHVTGLDLLRRSLENSVGEKGVNGEIEDSLVSSFSLQDDVDDDVTPHNTSPPISFPRKSNENSLNSQRSERSPSLSSIPSPNMNNIEIKSLESSSMLQHNPIVRHHEDITLSASPSDEMERDKSGISSRFQMLSPASASNRRQFPDDRKFLNSSIEWLDEVETVTLPQSQDSHASVHPLDATWEQLELGNEENGEDEPHGMVINGYLFEHNNGDFSGRSPTSGYFGSWRFKSQGDMDNLGKSTNSLSILGNFLPSPTDHVTASGERSVSPMGFLEDIEDAIDALNDPQRDGELHESEGNFLEEGEENSADEVSEEVENVGSVSSSRRASTDLSHDDHHITEDLIDGHQDDEDVIDEENEEDEEDDHISDEVEEDEEGELDEFHEDDEENNDIAHDDELDTTIDN